MLTRLRSRLTPRLGGIGRNLRSVAGFSTNPAPQNGDLGPDGFQRPIVCAHRGLPGYHLEHDYPGYNAAIETGAHYIEYDVTMTKDDQLIIVHDSYLDSEFNSAEVFPSLRKNLYLLPALDGDPIKFENVVWQHDLTYSDMMQSGLQKSYEKYKARYPGRKVALEERAEAHKPVRVVDSTPVLEKLREQRVSEGKQEFGLVVELKRPRFYEALGKDLPTPLAKALTEFKGNIIIQCFEPLYLQKMKELEAQMELYGTKSPDSPPWSYMQLTVDEGSMRGLGYPEKREGEFAEHMYTLEDAMDIAVPDDEAKFDAYFEKIGQYANIFAPWKRSLQPMEKFPHHADLEESFATPEGQARGRNLIASARKHGLEVAPYTFRADLRFLPRIYDEDASAEMMRYLEIGCTGVFTDFANVGVKATSDFKNKYCANDDDSDSDSDNDSDDD